MTQASNSAWNSEAAKSGKAVDWIFVIAGWPTVYSVKGSGYTLAGDLANFTTIQPWASAPKGVASVTKGRPEEGSQTIDRWSVDILDRQSSVGRHSLSDLVSRQAYVLGNAGSGHTTVLTAAVAPGDTTITVSSTTGFASSGNIYIGQECIHYTSTTGTTFAGCTRGYLLTQATSHKGPPSAPYLSIYGNRFKSSPQTGAKVYDFLPNIYRRMAYVYRGYQGISSTANWLRSLGGVIVEDKKNGAAVTVTCQGITWELYAKGQKMLADTITNAQTFDELYLFTGGLVGDFTVQVDAPTFIGNLGNGHYAIKVGQEWMGIVSAALNSGTVYDLTLVRSLNNLPINEFSANPKADVAWSNLTFSTSVNPAGTEPINLLRDFLESVDGAGAAGNGTYDVFETGVGCGIPQGLVNDTTFANIRSSYDWDTNAALFFLFQDATPAKEFIEKEILRPFGLYLFLGNDGKLNLARPKHPQKYYIGGTNNSLKVKVAAGGTTFTATMYVGVYTAQEMATEIARALNAVSSNFTASYDTTAHKFSIQHSGSTWDLISSTNNGWNTLGYTAQQLGVAAGANATSDTATGAFSGITLTEADIWDVQEQDSRDMQVTSVVYEYDYDWDQSIYKTQREYIDAEAVNLGDVLGAHRYVIQSKGLISTANRSLTRRGRWSWLKDSGTCTPTVMNPPTSVGVDADTFSQLVALTILDRYRYPPLKIKFKTKWSGGTDASSQPVGVRFEVADNFKLSYSPKGVIVDRERATDTLVSRVFEVIEKNENNQAGWVEITALAHRYVSY